MKWASRGLLSVLMPGILCSSALATTLNADAAALTKGSQPFAGTAWSADVEYAVYAPATYPGSHPDKDAKYIYAYQVFASSAGTATLTSLSLNLPVGAGAASPGDDLTYGMAGGVAPLLSRLTGSPPTIVQWVLDVDGGEHSTVLLFSSPNSHTLAAATLANGGVGDTQSLPTPLPEPTTMALLALGALVLVRRWRRP